MAKELLVDTRMLCFSMRRLLVLELLKLLDTVSYDQNFTGESWITRQMPS